VLISVFDADFLNKGNALKNLNQFDEVIQVYDQVLEINPQDSYAWDGKGNAFSDLGLKDEAIKAYDKALEINPQDPYALKGK
jgi:tetratricopeptide (TPR) repeat protein